MLEQPLLARTRWILGTPLLSSRDADRFWVTWFLLWGVPAWALRQGVPRPRGHNSDADCVLRSVCLLLQKQSFKHQDAATTS